MSRSNPLYLAPAPGNGDPKRFRTEAGFSTNPKAIQDATGLPDEIQSYIAAYTSPRTELTNYRSDPRIPDQFTNCTATATIKFTQTGLEADSNGNIAAVAPYCPTELPWAFGKQEETAQILYNIDTSGPYPSKLLMLNDEFSSKLGSINPDYWNQIHNLSEEAKQWRLVGMSARIFGGNTAANEGIWMSWETQKTPLVQAVKDIHVNTVDTLHDPHSTGTCASILDLVLNTKLTTEQKTKLVVKTAKEAAYNGSETQTFDSSEGIMRRYVSRQATDYLFRNMPNRQTFFYDMAVFSMIARGGAKITDGDNMNGVYDPYDQNLLRKLQKVPEEVLGPFDASHPEYQKEYEFMGMINQDTDEPAQLLANVGIKPKLDIITQHDTQACRQCAVADADGNWEWTYDDNQLTSVDYDRLLVLHGQGLNIDQGGFTFEVIWHIEYIPKGGSIVNTIQSPSVPYFNKLIMLLNDPTAYPIVTTANSFWSSAWHVMTRIGDKLKAMVGGAIGGASVMSEYGPVAGAAGALFGLGFGLYAG